MNFLRAKDFLEIIWDFVHSGSNKLMSASKRKGVCFPFLKFLLKFGYEGVKVRGGVICFKGVT